MLSVICRTACLGQWVTEALFGEDFQEYNQQKVRADLFLDLINNIYKRPLLSEIKPWLKRGDMDKLIEQQEKLPWLNVEKPNLLIMDSYAELTDQKFVHKNNWAFCCNYGDLKHEECENELACFGLLKHEKMENYYDIFFNYIKQTYNIPIIFIHFPLDFERRATYLNQGLAIHNSIFNLSSKYKIQNIIADNEFIEQKDNETYHFSDKTVTNIASKIII